jgi:hypothetical protein
MKHLLSILFAVALIVFASACSQLGGVSNLVPTTGNTANDASAVQRFIPNLSAAGYTGIEAASVQQALSTVSGGGALLTGNPALSALIAQLDGMVSCYRRVGAADARIYYQSNIANIITGNAVPAVGALAVINQDRLVNNFLSCALGAGQGLSAQNAVQICSSSGSVRVNNETISYIYAATSQQLCDLMASPFAAYRD